MNHQYSKVEKIYFVFQFGLMFVLFFLLLLGLSITAHLAILGAVGASSLASSTCIVMLKPLADTSSLRNIYGSYLMGLLTGMVCYGGAHFFAGLFPFIVIGSYSAFFGALAVVLTTFFMMIFRMIHPPAAGFSLALLIDTWHPMILIILIIYLVVLTLTHHYIRRILKLDSGPT